jgi:aminoacyl-tRNA hydrolase
MGNPGTRFHNTIHNLGYRVLDALAQGNGSSWRLEPEGWVSSIDIGEVTVLLLKPGMKMNSIGVKVRPFLEKTGSDLRHCIIVHDDMDLFLGDVRLMHSGGDGGHNGVRSVISTMGTVNIQRVRLGVRRTGVRCKPKRFVHEKVSPVEEETIAQMIEKAAAILRLHIQTQFGRK